jgi:RNA polymerase sigma factor (sigma-70 family)
VLLVRPVFFRGISADLPGSRKEHWQVKILYQFANGEISEIEVSDELGEILLGLDRQERNNDRRETRRHVSLDGMDYEGGFFSSDSDTADQVALNMELDALRRAMDTLTPQQRDLVRKVFFDGRSIASIAREEGVTKQSVHERVQRILSRIKKFLELDP